MIKRSAGIGSSQIRCLHATNVCSRLQKMKLQIPGNSSRSTEPNPDPKLSHSIDESLLTEAEMDFIKSTPFASSFQVVSRNEELSPTVQNIAKYVPIRDGFLGIKRYPNAITPFEALMATETEYASASEASLHVSKFPRLSVTKLLTNSWCELRDFYQIYSQLGREETPAMTRGKQIHHELEVDTHEMSDYSEILLNLPPVKMGATENVAELTVEKIIRLLNLFSNGHAREIYIQAYMNENEALLQHDHIKPDDILLTGIVDHLILQTQFKDRNPLSEVVESQSSVGDKIDTIAEILTKYNSNYRVVVSDVKTRLRRTIPTQDSIIQSSKHQVMFYQKMLKVLGTTELSAYKYLEEYYKRQGIVDLDAQIDPSFAIALVSTNGDIFLKDFGKLALGIPLNIPELDNLVFDKSYDLSEFEEQIQDVVLFESLQPILVKWKKPLTLRYFLMRLSQIFHQVQRILSGDLRIEYYFNNDLFKMIDFKHDNGLVNELTVKGIHFWNGQRDPEPIAPTLKNLSEKCRYCDFKNNCSWNHDALTGKLQRNKLA